MIIVVIFINSIMMNIITASLVVQYHHQARLLPLSAPTGPWVLSSLLLRQCIILYTTMIILLSPTYSDCLIFNILDFVFCFHHPVHDHYLQNSEDTQSQLGVGRSNLYYQLEPIKQLGTIGSNRKRLVEQNPYYCYSYNLLRLLA